MSSAAPSQSLSLAQRNLDALLERITWWACKEKLKDERVPKTKAELEQVQDLIARTIARAGIFHIEKGKHEKQDLFWELKNPIKLFCAGNQSGKSMGLLGDLGACILGCRPWDMENDPIVLKDRPILCVVAGPDYTTWAALNVIPKLQALLPWKAIVTHQSKMQGGILDAFTLWNGNQVKIMSYEQDDFKFESWTIDVMFWDEPMPQGKYYAARRGSMAYKAPHVMGYTPRKEAWTYDSLKLPAYDVHSPRTRALAKDKEIVCVHATSYDNPYIPREEIERYERDLPEEERQCRIYGEYRSLQGLVYKTFDPEKHVRSLQMQTEKDWEMFDRWPKALVVDPHDRKPFACAWAVVTPMNQVHWFAEWPMQNFWQATNPGWGVEGYARMFRSMEQGDNVLGRPIKNVVWRIMDPQFGHAMNSSTGLCLQEEFQAQGFDFDCSVDNDIPSGHLTVRQYLDEPPRMFWTPELKNFIHAMARYMYDDFLRETFLNLKEKPKDEYKDYADLARYLAKSDLCYIDLEDFGGYQQEYPSLG